MRLAMSVTIIAILSCVAWAAEPVSSADENAIRAVIARQASAWNRHDMNAHVADTTVDVDWVNIVGTHWVGREAVPKAHEELHKGIFAHRRLLLPDTLDLRKITPDVIIAVKTNRIEGAAPLPNGKPYPTGGNIMTFVFLRTDQGWRITHAHNTSINRAE